MRDVTSQHTYINFSGYFALWYKELLWHQEDSSSGSVFNCILWQKRAKEQVWDLFSTNDFNYSCFCCLLFCQQNTREIWPLYIQGYKAPEKVKLDFVISWLLGRRRILKQLVGIKYSLVQCVTTFRCLNGFSFGVAQALPPDI